MKKTTTSRTRTSPPRAAHASSAGAQPERRHPQPRQSPRRTPVRPGGEDAARPPLTDAERASHGGDATSDDRLAHALEVNAGRSPLARHRERLTGTENEEDGVPEDEDAMEDAAQAELDAEAEGPPRHLPPT